MRYAAVVAASVAVVGTLVFARDGRSEAAPALPAAAAATAPARLAQQQPAAGRAASQEDFRWAGRLARGQQIEVRGIVGSVTAVASSGDQVEVVGRRIGEDARPGAHRGGGERRRRHRLRHLPRAPANGAATAATAAAGLTIPAATTRTMASRAARSKRTTRSIDFTVRVPAGVKFASRTVSGDVNATGLRSAVDVATVSGDVEVSTTGTARAATVSGNVDGHLRRNGRRGHGLRQRERRRDPAPGRQRGRRGERAHPVRRDRLRLRPARARQDDEDNEGAFHISIGSAASGTIGRGGPS